jgi:hypothetical protein
MTIGDLSGGSAQLSDSFDSLQAAWEAAATRWNDAASRRFHKERVEPLEPLTRRAILAIQRMAEVLGRAERECGEE